MVFDLLKLVWNPLAKGISVGTFRKLNFDSSLFAFMIYYKISILKDRPDVFVGYTEIRLDFFYYEMRFKVTTKAIE